MERFSEQYLTEDDDGAPPDCFGDRDCYSPTDRECRQCEFRVACGASVRSAKRTEVSRRLQSRERASAGNHRRRGAEAQTRERTDVVRTQTGVSYPVESSGEESFAAAVMHNAALNATQGIVDTLSRAVSQIPRIAYRKDMFSNHRKRKKE